MKTLGRKLVTIAAASLMFVGLGVVGAPVANAGNCTAPGICGRIYNPTYTGLAFGIIHNWGEGYGAILYSGQHSYNIWSDTDGFYVGPGFCARWGHPIPNGAGGVTWYDRFYNGPRSVKVPNNVDGLEEHVTIFRGSC